MKIKFNEDGTIRIDDVRLSYPHLFTPYAGKSDDGKDKKPKFSGRFLMPDDTHAAEQAALTAHLVKLQKEWFKQKLPSGNLFFRDGDETGKEEFEDMWYVQASESLRPQVLGAKKEALQESDDVVYGGCYVNVLIKPWKQDNSFGKKINANLIGVQFKRDGERFGAERPNASEAFDSEGGDTDGFDD